MLNAGLGSRHKIIANRSISLWNSTFGQTNEELDYPARLQDILVRLSSITEISLAGLDITHRGPQQVADSFEFADTPGSLEELEDRATGTNLTSTMPVLHAKANHGKNSKTAAPDVEHETSKISSKEPLAQLRQKALSSPVPRLRHDDSQVQFTAIERSPPSSPTADSQLLTARQKDVRTRQQEEAAAAPLNLRSSPNPLTTPKDHVSESFIAGAGTGKEHINVIDTFSPALPHPSTMVPFLGSSPTPSYSKSARKTPSQAFKLLTNPTQQEDDNDSAENIPSSPPVPLPRKRYLSKKGATGAARAVAKSSPAKPTSMQVPPDPSEGRPSSFPHEKDLSEKTHVQGDKGRDKGKNDLTSLVGPAENASTNRLETSPRRTYQAVKESLHQRKRTRTLSQKPKETQKDDESDRPPKRSALRSSLQDPTAKPTTNFPEHNSQSETMVRRHEPPPDEEDLVSSQLEMEMARAASFSAATTRESANEELELATEDAGASQPIQGEEDNSKAKKQPKKRGRKPKKTQSAEASQVSESAGDVIYDCIIVSSSPRAASRSPNPVTLTEPDAPAKSGKKRTSLDIASEHENAVQEEALKRSKDPAKSRRSESTEVVLEQQNDGQEEAPRSSQASTRSKKRSSREVVPEQEAIVQEEAAQPSKRQRLSRHSSRVDTPPSSDAVAPPKDIAMPDEPGQVTEQALSPLRDAVVASGNNEPSTSQLENLMEEAMAVPMERQDSGLVPDMEKLLTKVKQGVRPDDRKALWKVSMELMKAVTEQCQSLMG